MVPWSVDGQISASFWEVSRVKIYSFVVFFFDEIYPSRPGELYFHATYNSDETVDSTV